MASRTPLLVATTAAALVAVTTVASPVGAADGAAPGRPGREADYLPADKTGFGTSMTTASTVWYTLQGGRLSEIYYPDITTPATRALEFAVTDGATFTTRDADAVVRTTQADPRSLTYRQIATDRRHRWQLTKTYVTDVARSSVVVDVRFRSLTGRPYRVYALFDPDLSANGNDDSGHTRNGVLLANDARAASALAGPRPFAQTSTGYLGRSDGWTDLVADHRLDAQYTSSPDGNVAQVALTDLDGVRNRGTTLAIGFGSTPDAAVAVAKASVRTGFRALSKAYATGWHRYLAGLHRPPATLRGVRERQTYLTSVLVLAAGEDKIHRGAFVASPSMPWAWAYNDELAPESGPYHLIWPRDEYQMATALLAAGDRAAARRALTYMLTVQQQPDGHLPQNTRADGTPYWTSIQLDQTADPIVLAWQLHRRDAATWARVRRAAEFLLSYELDGYASPYTQQERWEEQSGYSPATIAAVVAGLVCAADLARSAGDPAAADRYLAAADRWQRDVDRWTVTRTGPYSPKPYYVRLTKDGNPDAATTYNLGNSGVTLDQRAVVDPSFLELVRLGVKPADDPVVRNTVAVVDEQLSYRTPNGRFWHRYTGDGYGETRTGEPWDVIYPQGSQETIGRLWPIFAGERGEYELLAGGPARQRLADMARTRNVGGMLPEQVWDQYPPSGTGGRTPGTPTFSATPLLWTHAQYVRLAWSIQVGEPVERPAVVARRYAGAR